MTDKDRRLIERAGYYSSNEQAILSLVPLAETEEARRKLNEMADEAFAVQERIAFEHYD